MNTVNHIDTKSIQWKTVGDGVEMFVLRFEPGEVRTLLRFAPGKGYAPHRHPDGEEVFVLDGVYKDMDTEYGPGTYLYYPPNSEHSPISPTGCTILVMSPEPPINL
ncbi:cupin domain-containing protein [Halobacillus shinanisalinarum]|uniref:Cupin domain-containing protein n=1 Tax=Halobacillus shinanisalinarum TaxID=2932258 RepID=A0ABY4H3V5_9BACI|nr:cupin domain-containing protein [Halobacillus shinanisalinarum]UOQ94800.1 cupin domain-containing protein [Halobacillus shinanisalinarum]